MLELAGFAPKHSYGDQASGKRENRSGSATRLKARRECDMLAVWKLERLGRGLRHLINIVHDLTACEVGINVLTGSAAAIHTTSAAGKLVFSIFSASTEFEREIISERPVAELTSAPAREHSGKRSFKMTPAKLRVAVASMGKPETNVGPLCEKLGVTRQTLYRHVSPSGELRPGGEKLIRP